MKIKPTMNIPTATVLLAGLALIGGYGEVASAQGQSGSQPREASQHTSELAADIHKLINNLKIVEDGFSLIIKSILVQTPARMPEQMDANESLVELGSLLESFRGMEITLRTAPVPAELFELHMDLRRKMARAREKIAITRSLIAQMVIVPDTAESHINTDGLRALADYSTKRLITLANA